MALFEERINKACDSREIPGVVLLAVDKNGIFFTSLMTFT